MANMWLVTKFLGQGMLYVGMNEVMLGSGRQLMILAICDQWTMGENLARNKIGLSKDAQPKAETVSLELDLINCLTKTIRRCDEVNLTIKARSNSEQGCLRF